MTEKRYSHDGVVIKDHLKEDLIYIDGKDELLELAEYVDRLQEENEELKQSVNNLKDTIIKITIAYQRKYDRTIVDLVDEVHEEDITDLMKELKE